MVALEADQNERRRYELRGFAGITQPREHLGAASESQLIYL